MTPDVRPVGLAEATAPTRTAAVGASVAPEFSEGAARGVIAVVVPTYCERDSLPGLLEKLLALECGYRLEPWVIDDASPDGTASVARSFRARDERVHLVERACRSGRGPAVVDGFQRILRSAPGRLPALIVEMDGDASHDPLALPSLIAAAADADVILGSRYVDGGRADLTRRRRLLSRVANGFARVILGLRPRDCSTGFRCYRLPALTRVDLEALETRGHATHLELLYRLQRAGLRIREVPIHYRPRAAGRSKVTVQEVLRVGVELFRIRLRAFRSGGLPVLLRRSPRQRAVRR